MLSSKTLIKAREHQEMFEGRNCESDILIDSMIIEIEKLNTRLLNAFQLVKNGKKIGHLKYHEFSKKMDSPYDHNGNEDFKK